MALKDDILEELVKNRGRTVSGEMLAKLFGVSRGGVSKAVSALIKSGEDIVVHPNKGYEIPKNYLSKSVLSPYLADDIKLYYYNSVDSTNTQGKRLLADGETAEKILLVANEQTAGRGRLGRSFYSPKGTGIYFSFVFKPSGNLSDSVFITTATAVAIVRAVEQLTNEKPVIKWVNDVFLNGKKMCGILSEAISDFESGEVQNVIVGIGINFTTKDFPQEINGKAGSLNDEKISRAELISAVVRELSIVAENLSDKSIIEDYRNHSLVIGKNIKYIIKGEEFFAHAVGIDDNGGLVVKKENGEILTLNTGEISVRME